MTVLAITIQRRGEAGYPVVAELTVGAQMPTRSEGLLQLDRVELLALLDPLSYGTLLGQGVLSRGVRDVFVRARAGGETVHVLLFVEAPELRDLRWERLCAPLDDDRWDFLARDPRVPLSIHLPTATDRRFPPCGRADMRALVLVASPPGLERFGFSPFDAAGALRSVREGLGDIPHDCLGVEPGSVGPPTLRALTERLVAGHYTMLHVVCHGLFKKDDGETAILIAGDDGRAEPVTAARLITQMRGIGGSRGLPRFVFLATCESADPRAEGALGGLAHRLVRDLGVPAVIAMTEKVSQATALALGRVFYPRLREHGEVDRALVEALALVGERFDAAVPAVFSRLAGRPLFTDDPGRAPTSTELRRALDAFAGLLPIRAPALVSRFEALARQLRPLVDADDETLAAAARRERGELLEQFDALCEEVADVSSTALALGKSPPAYDATCPFPGLQAFRGDESRFFFGRDALLDRLERELQEAPFLAVLGQSGSGKSSAVLAGLVPRLVRARPGLVAVTIVPGAEPTARLAQALADAGLAAALARASQPRRRKGRAIAEAAPLAVLVVDQLEEAFTLCTDADRRTQFFAQLLALSDEMQVVVTLRADFLGEVAPYVDLRTAIERHQVIVAPMTPTEMRAAIEQQAAAVGLRFDGDLMATILADVQAEPGAMPLLQHALLELWRRRHGRWLRADEYRALGGVSRAIAETADTIFRELDDDDRERVRRIFTRLTRVDVDAAPGGERRDTRRRLALVELVPAGEDPAPIGRLIARLAGDRLLVTANHPQTGEETVEVSHEALIRRWPRLQTWLDEDLEGMRKVHQLGEAAAAWSGAGRGADLIVHRGVRLAEIQELAASGRFPLNRREAEYLAACVEAAERSRREEEAARARELEQARAVAEAQRQRAEAQEAATRAIRRRARIIAVIGVLAVITAIASVVLYRRSEVARAEASESRQVADAERNKAEEAQRQAEAGEAQARDALLVSTVDRIANDPTRQALVLREVGSLGQDPAWDAHLLRVANAPRALSGFDSRDLGSNRAASDPRRDLHAPDRFADHFLPQPDDASVLAFDAAGEHLLSLGQAGDVTLRRVRGATPLWTSPLTEQRAQHLIAAGRGVITLGRESATYVALTPAHTPEIEFAALAVLDLDVRPERTRVLVLPNDDGTPTACDLAVVEIDPSAGTATARCLIDDRVVRNALFLPTAGAVLSLANDGRATVHALSGGTVVADLTNPFRPFGNRAGKIWGLWGAVRNGDGTRVALYGRAPAQPGGDPRTAKLQVHVWRFDADGRGEPVTRRDCKDLWNGGVVLDGDAPLVVDDGTVWTVADGTWIPAARLAAPGADVRIKPLVYNRSARLLAAGVGRDVALFESGARRLRYLSGHAESVKHLSFSADGRRLASADGEQVRIWDTQTQRGERIHLTASDSRLLDVSHDGRRVLVGQPTIQSRQLEKTGEDIEIASDGPAIVVAFDEPTGPWQIDGEIYDARFLADARSVAVTGAYDGEPRVAAVTPGSTPTPAAPESGWHVDAVFADPTRTFLDLSNSLLWGLRPDGRGWSARPPGKRVTRVSFAPDGASALFTDENPESKQIKRIALLARSGEFTELRAAPTLPPDHAVSAVAWSPDGSRIAAVYSTDDGACLVHWALSTVPDERRTCFGAAEVPGGASGLAEPRHGLAWSPDGRTLAGSLGDGTVLLDARGDGAARWLGSAATRGKRNELRFSPGGEWLIETTARGAYVWRVDGGGAPPFPLVEFDPSKPPDALRVVPIDDGRGLVTVALEALDVGARLGARRWTLDRAEAITALSSESPLCLDPAWRAANLHETEAVAKARYCACRLDFKTPDDMCSSP